MDLMTIGAFAGRTRLSAKALRLYDRLGLLTPARVDPDSGYRFYGEDQVATARLIALLRRLGMPLTAIADIAAKPPGEAAAAVGAYWSGVESATADRRVLASYIQAKLTGGDMPSYDITTRAIPRRTILSISRHLHGNETNAFFADAFARLRSAAPGLEGAERPEGSRYRSHGAGIVGIRPLCKSSEDERQAVVTVQQRLICTIYKSLN